MLSQSLVGNLLVDMYTGCIWLVSMFFSTRNIFSPHKRLHCNIFFDEPNEGYSLKYIGHVIKWLFRSIAKVSTS